MMLSEGDEFEIVIEDDDFLGGIQETDHSAIVINTTTMKEDADGMFLTPNTGFTTSSMEGKTKRSVFFNDTVKTCQYGRGDPVVGVTERWTVWAYRMISPDKTFPFFTNEDICCLELAAVDCLGVFNGSVLIKNISFEKNVIVRLSVDEWESFVDIAASFRTCYESNGIDVFEFEYDLSASGISGDVKLSFAVCCAMDEVEYWDNNDDTNYEIITCSDQKSPSPLIIVPLKEEEEDVCEDSEGEEESNIPNTCAGVYANYFLPTSLLLRDWSSI